jgi:hypothetical protein
VRPQESCNVSGRMRNAVDIKALALSSQGSSGKGAASRTKMGLMLVRYTFNQWLEAEEQEGCFLSPPLAVGRKRKRVLTLLVDSRIEKKTSCSPECQEI